MKIQAIYSYVLLGILTVSCSTEPNDSPPEEVAENPISASLVFPEDKTECNEGTIISDTQSRVEFRWESAANTDSYEVIVTHAERKDSVSFETMDNSQEITIDRGANYEWYVVSNSDLTTVTATSETFSFYNAAASEVHHVPFSAEAIAPENESEVTTTSGQIKLQWEASDIDEDIKEYEVYFGVDAKNLERISVQASTTLNVDVTIGNDYYWSIKTIDETNNTAVSETFSFSVL